MRPLSTIASSTRKRFQDTFNRSNTSTSLETSSDGGLWSAIRGTFKVTSNKAQSTDSPSTYPLATVTMPKNNVSISLKGVSQGATAALWVTDSGNWWGVGIDQESIVCNCQTCANTANVANYNYVAAQYGYPLTGYNYVCNSASYPAASYNYNCNTYNYGNCNNGFRYPCNRTGSGMCLAWSYVCNVVGNRYCTNPMYPIASYNYMCNSASYPGNYSYVLVNNAAYPVGNYNTVTYYNCNCQTCYPQYVRFIQSVSGTVTTLTSWLVSSVIQSFKVTTSGANTTVKVYSDTDLVTQIGSDLTYTPSGITITPQHGIMIKPSSYSQGNTIDEITMEVQ